MRAWKPFLGHVRLSSAAAAGAQPNAATSRPPRVWRQPSGEARRLRPRRRGHHGAARRVRNAAADAQGASGGTDDDDRAAAERGRDFPRRACRSSASHAHRVRPLGQPRGWRAVSRPTSIRRRRRRAHTVAQCDSRDHRRLGTRLPVLGRAVQRSSVLILGGRASIRPWQAASGFNPALARTMVACASPATISWSAWSARRG